MIIAFYTTYKGTHSHNFDGLSQSSPWVWGLIPGGVVYFHLKIFNLGARSGADVDFLIARLYITGLD